MLFGKNKKINIFNYFTHIIKRSRKESNTLYAH